MQTHKQREQRAGNLCLKTRPKDNPYEIWVSGDWKWAVLKKWQANDDKPYGRWFCFVTSPLCPEGEYGDVYVKDIKDYATKDTSYSPTN